MKKKTVRKTKTKKKIFPINGGCCWFFCECKIAASGQTNNNNNSLRKNDIKILRDVRKNKSNNNINIIEFFFCCYCFCLLATATTTTNVESNKKAPKLL